MRSAAVASVRWIAIVIHLIALQTLTLSAAAQSPDIAFHDLKWYVHDSLIDTARPLSFYEDLIERATEDVGIILMGDSGPIDNPCCADLSVVSVSSFSDQGGHTWASMDSVAEFTGLDLVDARGHRAFIVGGITFCGGPGNPIGCAQTPPCGSDPPNLRLVIDIAAETDFGVFANTLAHERGHNSCLEHVSGNSCELMGASSGGDCVSASECDEFREERTSTGAACVCHTASAVLEDDGEACSQSGVTGICSGGVCGEIGSDASVTLVASAGTAALEGDTPDDPLLMSGIPGGWTDLGEFDSSYTPQGLAYADDRGKTFAVSPTAGDDVLLQIDPTDGSATLVGSISGVSGLRGLAYDPGPTTSPSDDRLLAIDSQTFADLYQIDPDDASRTLLGSLPTGSANVLARFNGLAYDSANDRLYASSGFEGGIFVIALNPCCSTTVVNSAGPPRFESGIAYSLTTNSIYLIGGQTVRRTLYDTLDADALAAGTISSGYTRGLDGFTIGGLAATPVPEPGFGVSALAAGLCLWGASRLRRS
ncbi:MAG: hypothetical protein AAEJ52_00735 [Myxococcota bacterium]